MSHHRIAIEGLHYRYPDGTAALRGIDLEIQHGECIAIVGANGAGKSTLLQHLNGVLLPESGRVVIGDLAVTAATLPSVRRTVGTAFQDPDDQLFMPTVIEDVAFGPLNLGLSPGDAEAAACRALAEVDALELRDRAPHRLSGGEKRRAVLAAVLALGPDILVLDEPTAGLDPRSRRQLITLLRAFGHTRVIATHDLELVLEICPRTVLLDAGRVAADGPSVNLLADDAILERCRLERPASLRPCPACGRTSPAISVAPASGA